MKKIIIGILLTILLIICCYTGYTLLTPQTDYITYTIAESGTTLEIPKDMKLKSESTDSDITVLENDNTIIIIYNSADESIGQTIGFSNIKNPIFGNELQGNTTINNPTVAGCYLKGECNAVYNGNDETHDNIIVISKDKNIVNHIFNSIQWGKNTTDNPTTSTNSNNDETYPFYSDDGSIRGYYHVGDVVEHHDLLFQLKPGGHWVQIGQANSNEQNNYYDSPEDVSDDSYYESSSASQSQSRSSSDDIEVSTDVE